MKQNERAKLLCNPVARLSEEREGTESRQLKNVVRRLENPARRASAEELEKYASCESVGEMELVKEAISPVNLVRRLTAEEEVDYLKDEVKTLNALVTEKSPKVPAAKVSEAEKDQMILKKKVDVYFVEGEEDTYAVIKGKCQLIFNGRLEIVSKRMTVSEIYDLSGNITGTNREERFFINILNNGKVFQGEVELTNVFKGNFLSEISGGQVILEPERKVVGLFKKFVNSKIKKDNYRTEIVYKNPGWHNVEGMGILYITPVGVVGQPQLIMRSNGDCAWGIRNQAYCGQNLLNDFLAMRAVLPQKQGISIVFQYFLLASLLKTPLRFVGINLNFLLAIIGETNAKKTTLAKLFFKIYDRDGEVDIDFTATKIAMIEAMAENADAVTIFDDLTPPMSKSQAYELQNKLETLARGFGGNMPRRRSKTFASMNPGTGEFSPILSSGVFTGEIFPVALKSSRSRIVKVELNKADVDLKALTFQQSQAEVLPTFAWDFLWFATQNMSSLMQNAKNEFLKLRNENPLKLLTPRFNEDFAILGAVSTIWGAYLSLRWNLQDEYVSKIIKTELDEIAKILAENDAEINDKSDEVLIAEAILEEVSAWQNSTDGEKIKVKIMEDFACIRSEDLIEICRKKFASYGRFFQYSSGIELSKFLAKCGMICVKNEGSKRRYTLKISDRTNFRYYQFPLQKLYEVTANVIC